jgi:hypothetical protein
MNAYDFEYIEYIQEISDGERELILRVKKSKMKWGARRKG